MGSWVKTKIQAFNDILDAAILSVPVCGEDVEVTERFTYLGSDILVSADCEPEVNRHLGQAWSHGFTGLIRSNPTAGGRPQTQLGTIYGWPLAHKELLHPLTGFVFNPAGYPY